MTAAPDSPLPESASVVVIGGGVMGASAAFHLAEAGVRDVLLLERDQLASGSTSKAAGGVRAQFSDPVNIELGARGLAAFEQFHERPGWAIDLHQVGYLFVITDPGDLAAYEESVGLQQRMGVESRLLTAREASDLAPGIVIDDVLAAAFHARDGYCSPESVVHGYAAGARRHGAVVRTGVSVEGIEIEGTEIVAVQTSAGRVRTGAVVCTAGAWSKEVGAMAGVPLPVEPLRRQILITEPLSGSLASVLPQTMPMTIDAATTFYLHREGPGVLLGMSYAGERPGFAHDFSEDWMPDLVAAMERRCPSLLDVGIAHRWSGLYEVTPDNNALIGEAPGIERFLYATGFSGHGFLQGPAVGEVLRDLYLRREPVIDVSPFTADRFAGGALRAERNIV
ncbi:MAG: NAD(P)/FAD-dependent oxidoreductase [Candidatus Nanopelagicales bacterium]